jgi:hypothetical protein
MPKQRDYSNVPSEYGGVSGNIQPYPHEPTADEVLGMIAKTDPDDPNSTIVIPDRAKPAS